MSKYNFGEGQFIVYAKNEQEARQIIGQELQRFDNIKELMSNLLTQNGQALENFNTNTSEERLNIHFNDLESAIYDEDSQAKGEVRVRKTTEENGFYYELAYRYPEIDGHDANFRLAHEMGHLMLNVADPQRQVYNEETNSRYVSGLIRRDEETKQFYGEQIQENAINLIAQLAIRGNIKADDIVLSKVDLSEYNSYKKCDDLVKLLAVSMRNDFEEEMTFEQMVEQKIDSEIIHSDGTKEPANTFFYGLVNDSSIIENEFDKYLGKGAWRDLNNAFEQLYDTNLSNEKFELIFKNAQGLIQEFANARYQDKYREVISRNGNSRVPNIDNKLQLLNEMLGEVIQENINAQQQDIQLPEGYSINQYGEIIRPAKVQNQEQQVENNVEQNYSIKPNSYSQQLQTNVNKLSLKQKVARFLQKNNLFMNLSFVKKFVHKQMDILPEQIEVRENIEYSVIPTNKKREDFLNSLTNFGQYRDLPPIQRMSNPQKVEEMKRKMEQMQQSNEEGR